MKCYAKNLALVWRSMREARKEPLNALAETPLVNPFSIFQIYASLLDVVLRGITLSLYIKKECLTTLSSIKTPLYPSYRHSERSEESPTNVGSYARGRYTITFSISLNPALKDKLTYLLGQKEENGFPPLKNRRDLKNEKVISGPERPVEYRYSREEVTL